MKCRLWGLYKGLRTTSRPRLSQRTCTLLTASSSLSQSDTDTTVHQPLCFDSLSKTRKHQSTLISSHTHTNTYTNSQLHPNNPYSMNIYSFHLFDGGSLALLKHGDKIIKAMAFSTALYCQNTRHTCVSEKLAHRHTSPEQAEQH